METKNENILEVLLQRRKDTNTLSNNIGEDIDEGWERMTLVCTEDVLSYSHTDGRRDNFPYFDFFDKTKYLIFWLLEKEHTSIEDVVGILGECVWRVTDWKTEELNEHSLPSVLEDVEKIEEDMDVKSLEDFFENYEWSLGDDDRFTDRCPMDLENDLTRRAFTYGFLANMIAWLISEDRLYDAIEECIREGEMPYESEQYRQDIDRGWTPQSVPSLLRELYTEAEAELEKEEKIYKRILELDDRCRAYRLELVHEDAPWRGVPDIVLASIYFPDSIESLKLKKKLYGDYSGEGVADIEALCKEYEITEDELALCALFLDDSGFAKRYHVKEFPELLERITQNHLDRAKAYVRNHHILRNARKVVKYIQDCLEGQSSVTPRLLLAVDGNTKLTDNFLNTIYQCNVNEELFPAAKTFSDLSRLEKELNEIPFG